MAECLAQSCPPSLHAGFMRLFPSQTVATGELLVLTLSEQTSHDMTSWSPEVEEEREQLIEHVSKESFDLMPS